MASAVDNRPGATTERNSNSRPTLTLGNRNTTTGASFQSNGPILAPLRSTKNIPTYIVWSVFNLLFIPFGILCCYFSHKVKQLKAQNVYEAATKWSKRTLVLNLMSTLVMIGVIITIVMLDYDHNQRSKNSDSNETTTAAYIPWQPGR
ncbi:unnamed protein product [Adineta steineri]|uniref:Uncharacterized protein n=1 Tax=Adineta steineri TaxID=433720 RepID=A0A813ZVS7_9BILA|nr:unnamed protein product [Adineta steineri]CAF3643486.1 unnamed protein product [Adineta steineri]